MAHGFFEATVKTEIKLYLHFKVCKKMSNLSEYNLAHNVWRYAGEKLEYIDLTGKRGSGILVGMQVHQETQETIALFRVSSVSARNSLIKVDPFNSFKTI